MNLRNEAAECAKYLLTLGVVPVQRRRALRLQSMAPLQLHLGSATNRLPGWVNVDLLRPGRTLELYWDLRRPLPFRDGGAVRIGVLDLDRYVASYLGRDDLIDQVRSGRPTRGLALGEVFFVDGHRCMYDFETLRWAFREAGFTHVERCEFGKSQIEPAPDSESRRAETLYAEAWDNSSRIDL